MILVRAQTSMMVRMQTVKTKINRIQLGTKTLCSVGLEIKRVVSVAENLHKFFAHVLRTCERLRLKVTDQSMWEMKFQGSPVFRLTH